MNITDFKDYVRETINDHPNLKMEILDLYWLAMTEIHEGESEWNEINHAINSIGELIQDETEPQVGWDVAKNHIHDISCGIADPENYWYKKEDGIYYPQLRKNN